MKLWLKSLAAAGIAGGSTAVTAWGGFAVAQAVGVNVPTLNWKAAGIIFLTSAAHSVALYLAKSPLPGVIESESETSR